MAIWRPRRNRSDAERGGQAHDELCELVTVPSFEGPLLVADLEQHGIRAIGQEAFNVATRVASDARILVRRADLEAAQAVLVARSS